MTEIRIYDRGRRWTQYGWPVLYRYEAMEVDRYKIGAIPVSRALTLAGAERRARRLVARREPVRVIRLGADAKPVARKPSADRVAAS